MSHRSTPTRSSRQSTPARKSRPSVSFVDAESPNRDGNDDGFVYFKRVPTPGPERSKKLARMTNSSQYLRIPKDEIQLLREGLKGGRKINRSRDDDEELDARSPRRRSRSTRRSVPATHRRRRRSSRSSMSSRPSRSTRRSLPATHRRLSSRSLKNSRRSRKLPPRADVNPRRSEATREAVRLRPRDAQGRFVTPSKVSPARKSRNQRSLHLPAPQFDSSEDEESATYARKPPVQKRKKTKSPVFSSASEAEVNVSMTDVSPKLPKGIRTLQFPDDDIDRIAEFMGERKVKKVYRKSPDLRKAGKKFIYDLDDTTAEPSNTEEVEIHPRSKTLSQREKRPSSSQARHRRVVSTSHNSNY